MNALLVALWAEMLKVRKSKILPLTTAGFSLLPLVSGLFMVILKDPERAKALGLISVKAQITAGVADWSSFFGILTQGIGIAGGILFALVTTWVFGREFSDHTVKELLALPISRSAIVAAKFLLIVLWLLMLTMMILGLGLVIGYSVDIPGWSAGLQTNAFWLLLTSAVLNILLMPFVALFACLGRGYLPPMGWAFLTLALAQIAAVLGWGDWFPWSVPALASGMAGPPAEVIGLHSYIVVLATCLLGLAATFAWWHAADQSR